MTQKGPDALTGKIRIERTYNASIEDVWGVVDNERRGSSHGGGRGGFVVKVRKLDLRPGG